MILPTALDPALNTGMTTAKGYTLGAFGGYLLCQGQNQVDPLGYSALPINLVLAGYDQLRKIPGAQVPATSTATIKQCHNPTFSSPASIPWPSRTRIRRPATNRVARRNAALPRAAPGLTAAAEAPAVAVAVAVAVAAALARLAPAPVRAVPARLAPVAARAVPVAVARAVPAARRCRPATRTLASAPPQEARPTAELAA
jgi:hypothetical protein